MGNLLERLVFDPLNHFLEKVLLFLPNLFAALFILIIGSMRGLQALLALGVDWSQAVYLSYFIVGGILSVIGIVLFRKRNAATT